MADATWIVHQTRRCAHLTVTSEQWVRAPADTLDFWNRIDDDGWMFIQADGNPACDEDLVTVDVYARVVPARDR